MSVKMPRSAAVLVLSVGALGATPCGAQIVYERALLANTGTTVGSGIIGNELFYTGWRFQVVGAPIRTVNVGGHFFAQGTTAFGGIVRLTGPSDHPDSIDLTTPDLLGTALVSLPLPPGGSREATAPLALTLDPGWYMVIFGGKAFGASNAGCNFVVQDSGSAVPGAQNVVTYRQPAHPLGQATFVQGAVIRIFVTAELAPACCVDFNNDGEVDFTDVERFLGALVAMTPGNCAPGADFNNDGEFDFTDIERFLALYNAGC